MDLYLSKARATALERRAIDGVLGSPEGGWDGGRRRAEKDGRAARGGHEARSRRHLLLPALHAAQARVGWISQGALNYVCERLTIPPAEAYGVASFYGMFALARRAKSVVHVCDDVVCRVKGGEALCGEMKAALGAPGGKGKGGATWLRSPCLGLCEQAPAAMVTKAGAAPVESGIGGATAASLRLALEATPSAIDVRIPQFGEPGLRLLRRLGHVDPTSLDDYRAHGGYAALRRARELGPDGVVREVIDSKLMGRGGAAFPTGRKWDAVAKAPVRPHYLVCNADESEPGTFKDRILMEQDPFALLEAMTIAGYATGCETGYLYVRGEYPLAAERLSHAIAAARARGLLGDDVMGQGFRFDVVLRRGAGAYICGEETALFNSIEGYRGEPRNKPPFPVVSGLFAKPTVINNVETLVNVLDVISESGPAFARIGTEGSTGTKLFCISGHIARPGLYEVPFGTTLQALLQMAGGVPGGRRLKTVLLGGAAGSFVTPEEIAVPLTFEGTRAIGASLGSGVVVALDDSVDVMDLALRIAAFFRDESCGQCVPCRVGTVRQEEALHRIAKRRALGSRADEAALLREIGQVMRDASICGLGQTAASAIASAVSKLGLLDAGARVSQSKPPVRQVELTVDDQTVRVPEGTTLLEACRQQGIDTPTLCYLENLTPVNVCRVCVVEVEGARTLVPACSRVAEPGMKVKTDSERVRLSRRLVLEFLASSVDLSTAPTAQEYVKRYEARPERYGEPEAPAKPGERDDAIPGHHHAPGKAAASVHQPVKVDNDLYVRDYGKCILCYKCVEACGEDAQNTFAIAVAGRGFDARISTEFASPLPDSACVYCGNCIGVCPTGALMFKSEHDLRARGQWDEKRQTRTTTICTYCGVGCNLELHVQDNRIVKVTSPLDHDVTNGHLCIKGRFGWQSVQSREGEET